MRVIKIIALFLALQNVFSALRAQSQEMSPAAKSFKANIATFLREEGYTPTSEVNSNAIEFKREGEAYKIIFSGSRPVQVTMYIDGFSNKDANMLALLLACNEVNKSIYYVKTYISDFGDEDRSMISIEIPAHTEEDFRYVFSDCVRSLARAKEELIDAYNNYDNQYSAYSDSIAAEASSPAQIVGPQHIIVNNSNTLRSAVHSWKVESIDISPSSTIITKIVEPLQTETYICSTKEEYIEDAETGHKYYIVSSSIGFEQNSIILRDKKTKTFTEVYPALPTTVRRINISSGTYYYIKDLQIR